MKRLIFLSLLLVIIVSCKKEIPAISIIDGLATPFILQGDTTFFYLSDYVVDFRNLDSVEFPINMKISKENDSVYLVEKAGLIPPLSVIKLFKLNSIEEIVVFNREKQKVIIEYKGKEKFKSLKVIGSMNNWNRNNNGMIHTDSVWKQEFELSPGAYEYLFYSEGKEFADPENPLRFGNNSVYKVGKYLPEELPFISTVSFTEQNIEFSTDKSLTEIIAFWQNTRLNVVTSGNQFSINIPQKAKVWERSFIRVYSYNPDGISNDILIPLQNGKVVDNPTQINRGDKQTMIMYFLMVDRFFNGDSTNDEPVEDADILPKANYFGGDLQGVRNKLNEGYFSDLGINTLWLSPISQNPKGAFGLNKKPYTKFSGYHGYWPVSNINIDYRFGNPELLHTLIDSAHNKNMNVLLDYVAHHVHKEHPVYVQHPDWVTDLYLPDGSLNTEKWDEYRLTTWFDTFLPILDLRKKEIVDALVDSAVFWIKEYDIDGFRHDATKHIDELYWRTLTQKIKRLNNNQPFYQIGETYGSPLLISSYISSGMLDAQFDFNVYDNAIACFALDNENFSRLKTVLSESWKYYGYHNLMGNISGNQDRGRFISYAGGALLFSENAKLAGWTRNIGVGDSSAYNKLAMLHAFNMTIPGIPVIYYGDEIGLPGGNDPDNRRQMKFDKLTPQETILKNTVKKLIEIRKNNLALLYGQARIILADEKFLIITRNYFSENLLIVFNKSQEEQNVEIELIVSKNKLKSEFGSVITAENSKLVVGMKPHSFDIIHY